MAMTVKSTVNNTITEYNTVTSGSYTLDFKKIVQNSETTITCYPKKSGVAVGFISYNVTKKAFIFQLNEHTASDIGNSSSLYSTVISSIKEIA